MPLRDQKLLWDSKVHRDGSEIEVFNKQFRSLPWGHRLAFAPSARMSLWSKKTVEVHAPFANSCLLWECWKLRFGTVKCHCNHCCFLKMWLMYFRLTKQTHETLNFYSLFSKRICEKLFVLNLFQVKFRVFFIKKAKKSMNETTILNSKQN